MNDANRSRVVVWLDPTAPLEASLRALAGLGAASEILGLFVEDMDLLALSGLSVAREITFEGATPRLMEHDRTEQQFRAHGARMRTLFETAARKITARHSFRIARGVLRAELLKAAADCDTLVLTHSRRQLAARLTVRAQLGGLLAGGPRTLVIVQDRWQAGQRIAVLYSHGPESEVALHTAAAIARSEKAGLSVWLPEEGGGELQTRAMEQLGDSLDYSFRAVDALNVTALARAARAENAQVLVLPATSPEDTRRTVSELLDRSNCSIVVVR